MSWFFKILDTAGTNVAKVDTNGALIVAERPSGSGSYCVAAKTGTIVLPLPMLMYLQCDLIPPH